MVAGDGTQKFTRHQPFAAEALQPRVSETETRYRVYVVEAVLVAGDGLTLPLVTEFAENPPETSPNQTQDSEVKAFHRLARKLKQWFPRRRLLVVMDGLYPHGPVMAVCRQYHWDYMIVLPRDVLRSVWEEVDGLRRLDTQGEARREHSWGDRRQVFTWVNAIGYEWTPATGGSPRTTRVHVALCEETWMDAAGVAHQTTWAWVSGQPLTLDHIVARCNRAGRHRWAIEAEFLVEKRHGDHYEHAYSYDWQALKGWHYLMKLAHLLNVLTLWLAVGQTLLRYRGYRETLHFLRDTWTHRWLSPAFLHAHAVGPLTS